MATRLFTDQMGREVRLASFPPKKIVSLVPSLTELLFDLNAGNQVAGVTKFCIHPKHAVLNCTKIGGTKSLNIDKIISLNPDLIIGSKEENEKAQIEMLIERFPVWMSDVNTLDTALSMIRQIGLLTGHTETAISLSHTIAGKFLSIKSAPVNRRVIYLIWKNPWMAAGRQTFIHNMLERCGFENVCQQSRYPILSDADIHFLDPEIVLLSSEPYPFREKHQQELEELLTGRQILLVNGELFSWYGSRLQYSPQYFQNLQKELA